MTIKEAIEQLDELKHNTYTDEEKIRWLSYVDSMVKTEIIDTHEGSEGVTFEGYNALTDTSTELLVGAPYDGVYLRYMEAMIDYHNGEYTKYNNSMLMYNSAYTDYLNWYNRTHTPITRGPRFLF